MNILNTATQVNHSITIKCWLEWQY